jgi:hypothetical protein
MGATAKRDKMILNMQNLRDKPAPGAGRVALSALLAVWLHSYQVSAAWLTCGAAALLLAARCMKGFQQPLRVFTG